MASRILQVPSFDTNDKQGHGIAVTPENYKYIGVHNNLTLFTFWIYKKIISYL